MINAPKNTHIIFGSCRSTITHLSFIPINLNRFDFWILSLHKIDDFLLVLFEISDLLFFYLFFGFCTTFFEEVVVIFCSGLLVRVMIFPPRKTRPRIGNRIIKNSSSRLFISSSPILPFMTELTSHFLYYYSIFHLNLNLSH